MNLFATVSTPKGWVGPFAWTEPARLPGENSERYSARYRASLVAAAGVDPADARCTIAAEWRWFYPVWEECEEAA